MDGGRLRAIKVRLGDPDVQTHLEVVRSARRAVGSDVVVRLRELLHHHNVGALEPWLADATASGLDPFVSVAGSLTGDLVAVRNALLYRWSSGPVEGHIARFVRPLFFPVSVANLRSGWNRPEARRVVTATGATPRGDRIRVSA